MEDSMGEDGAADGSPAAVTRPRGWRRVPGWLGMVGALVGLVTFALPWYTVASGASYSGFSLLFTASIPYATPAYAPQGGDCYGALAGYNLPVALLAGVLLASLVGSVAMQWLLPRRRAAFALALTLLTISWLGESFPFSWTSATLPTTPIAGPWSCGLAGSQDLAFTVLHISLYVLIVAYIGYAFLTRPAAPWVGIIAATLGLGGFLLPWDLSGTPGAARIVSAIGCLNSAGWDAGRCIPSASFPAGAPLAVSTGALAQRAIAEDLVIYLLQLLMLLAVLVLALVVARWRTWRWMLALSVVSYAFAMLGNPSLLNMNSPQLGAAAPLGYGLVGLGFGMLFLSATAAKWDALNNTLRLALEKTRLGNGVRATAPNGVQ